MNFHQQQKTKLVFMVEIRVNAIHHNSNVLPK